MQKLSLIPLVTLITHQFDITLCVCYALLISMFLVIKLKEITNIIHKVHCAYPMALSEVCNSTLCCAYVRFVCFKICGCRVHITYVLFCLFQDLRMSCTYNVCVVLFVSRFADVVYI